MLSADGTCVPISRARHQNTVLAIWTCLTQSAAVDQNATCISELESLEAVKDERCRAWADAARTARQWETLPFPRGAFDELNQIPETSCAVRSGENATAWYVA